MMVTIVMVFTVLSYLPILPSCPFTRTIFKTVNNGVIDVDECESTQLNDCSPYASCTNTLGSYYCTFLSGFVGNGTTCDGMFHHLSFSLTIFADINECANKTPTNANCTNTIGSYYCACLPGFIGNGSTCGKFPSQTVYAILKIIIRYRPMRKWNCGCLFK